MEHLTHLKNAISDLKQAISEGHTAIDICKSYDIPEYLWKIQSKSVTDREYQEELRAEAFLQSFLADLQSKHDKLLFSLEVKRPECAVLDLTVSMKVNHWSMN